MLSELKTLLSTFFLLKQKLLLLTKNSTIKEKLCVIFRVINVENITVTFILFYNFYKKSTVKAQKFVNHMFYRKTTMG